MAVKKLEEELDVKLFERSANEVTVTALGEEIMRRRKVCWSRPPTSKTLPSAAKTRWPGHSSWALFTPLPRISADLVRQVIGRTPQMPLILQENFTVKLMEMLRTGEIDCAILAEPFPDTGLACAPVRRAFYGRRAHEPRAGGADQRQCGGS